MRGGVVEVEGYSWQAEFFSALKEKEKEMGREGKQQSRGGEEKEGVGGEGEGKRRCSACGKLVSEDTMIGCAAQRLDHFVCRTCIQMEVCFMCTCMSVSVCT
ncbi:hypothetical protein FACS189472_18380 [Alphaproteobacteria bacterium]|nr:hypothetical protein FACS189472_18380 [Alphaproteobacteria bacterium]